MHVTLTLKEKKLFKLKFHKKFRIKNRKMEKISFHISLNQNTFKIIKNKNEISKITCNLVTWSFGG